MRFIESVSLCTQFWNYLKEHPTNSEPKRLKTKLEIVEKVF